MVCRLDQILKTMWIVINIHQLSPHKTHTTRQHQLVTDLNLHRVILMWETHSRSSISQLMADLVLLIRTDLRVRQRRRIWVGSRVIRVRGTDLHLQLVADMQSRAEDTLSVETVWVALIPHRLTCTKLLYRQVSLHLNHLIITQLQTRLLHTLTLRTMGRLLMWTLTTTVHHILPHKVQHLHIQTTIKAICIHRTISNIPPMDRVVITPGLWTGRSTKICTIVTITIEMLMRLQKGNLQSDRTTLIVEDHHPITTQVLTITHASMDHKYTNQWTTGHKVWSEEVHHQIINKFTPMGHHEVLLVITRVDMTYITSRKTATILGNLPTNKHIIPFKFWIFIITHFVCSFLDILNWTILKLLTL